MSRLAGGCLAALAVVVLGACNPAPTWYEATCLRKGYNTDAPEYRACIERERQWLEQQRQRPGPPAGG
jgi:hypothetical protein